MKNETKLTNTSEIYKNETKLAKEHTHLLVQRVRKVQAKVNPQNETKLAIIGDKRNVF